MISPPSSVARNRSGLRPEDRRALIAGAAILAIAFAYSWVVRPMVLQLWQQREALQMEQANLARERALIASMQSAPRARAAVVAQLNIEAPRLFVGDSVSAMAELTSYATSLADAAFVQLAAAEAHAPETAQGVTVLTVDLRGQGNWRSVLSFVHSLESATRLVDVQSLRIERGARGGPLGGDLVSVSVTATGFSRSTQ